MQGLGAQTRLFSEVTGPPTIWANKKEVSNGPQKFTDPIFVNPPPEGLLNNAKEHLKISRKFQSAGAQRWQVMQNKNARISWPSEGGPNNTQTIFLLWRCWPPRSPETRKG